MEAIEAYRKLWGAYRGCGSYRSYRALIEAEEAYRSYRALIEAEEAYRKL